MFENYKIVCVTRGHKRRYVEVLARYILTSPVVDEYQLWCDSSTSNSSDAGYFSGLQKHSTKVRLFDVTACPGGPRHSPSQIYKNCVDANTIYIRFDEDIVFVEANFFVKFLRFRVRNPFYFLLFPNIVNNPFFTELLIKKGIIAPEKSHPWSLENVAWRHARFAEQLHRAFLESLRAGQCPDWHVGAQASSGQNITPQCMSWFGRDFGEFGGNVPEYNEEEWLSVIKPRELKRENCIYGDVVVSHFAYPPQEKHLESTDLLSAYSSAAKRNTAGDSACGVPQRNSDLWTVRLLDAIQNLKSATLLELASADYVATQIRLAGLVGDNRFLYGTDNYYMNVAGAGLWQVPMQLARWLVLLGRYEICRVIDIGTWTGWTTTFVTAYLARLNKHLHVTTVDVHDHFNSYPQVKELLPITFHIGTSADFRNSTFDFAFIDGDHTYDACRTDYDNVGRKAPICAFHDINDEFVSQYGPNKGGVPRFWSEMRSEIRSPDRFFEFLDHSQCRRVMGIGLILRSSAKQR